MHADTLDPYFTRLIKQDTVREVNLDVSALDERDEYVLSRSLGQTGESGTVASG